MSWSAMTEKGKVLPAACSFVKRLLKGRGALPGEDAGHFPLTPRSVQPQKWTPRAFAMWPRVPGAGQAPGTQLGCALQGILGWLSQVSHSKTIHVGPLLRGASPT